VRRYRLEFDVSQDSTNKVAFERIGENEELILIPLANIGDIDFIYEVLCDTFDACFAENENQYIIDLEGIEPPDTKLISLLIETTSRARRCGGDVKIINFPEDAGVVLSRFSVNSYLLFDDSEKDDGAPANLRNVPPVTQTIQFHPLTLADFTKEITPNSVVPTLSAADIAEDPIIELLGERLKGEADSDKIQPPPSETSVDIEEEATKTGERNHLRVKSLSKNLYVICDFVIKYASRAGFDKKVTGKMRIAVYEACLNVIEHAYHSKPDNWIDVWIEYNEKMFKITIQDYGVGFHGFGNQKFDVMSAMDERQTGGFGLYIIKRSVDLVEYRPDETHGNRLTMVKYIPSKTEPPEDDQ